MTEPPRSSATPGSAHAVAEPRTLERRSFIKGLAAAGGTLGIGLTGAACATGATADRTQAITSSPQDWRRLFTLDRSPVFMNVGTVGSPPADVLRVLEEQQRLVARQALSA